MYFKQFYLGCLAHASYLIGSDGEAAVVDPQRDVDQYITEAEAEGFRIKYVIETHLHADFVSGHRELAARTGAEIVFSERAGATFPHRAVRDGDELQVGKITLRIMETPGHTPESVSILVISDESKEPQKILTGDTLFVGDVGRPDLAGGKGYTPAMMAEMMYDTLHNKLLKLPDEVEVYPAHGAGSMCGKNMSKETWSTIGQQRQFNYAVQPMSKDAFVRMMTTDLTPAPDYFSKDAEINRGGAEPLSDLPPPEPLTAERVRQLTSQTDGLRYVVLDVRSASEFGGGHLPGSINIGLGGQFAIWAGSLITMTAPIVIVAESEEKVAEAQMRLARVGLENVKGYLQGGVKSWREAGFELATVPQVSVDELHDLISREADLQVIDVRRPAEYESGHIGPAKTAPLADLKQKIGGLGVVPSKKTAVVCAGGYRSSAATSILEQHGFTNLLNVTGGTGAWIKAGYPVE
ncbi:MAG TPA: rhodanese-like domain-containing protein [Pyrinomonadaceae bacterium]|nr:rhodanese-like domain-containing protein [Pyrinomonadaceae bacterium]